MYKLKQFMIKLCFTYLYNDVEGGNGADLFQTEEVKHGKRCKLVFWSSSDTQVATDVYSVVLFPSFGYFAFFILSSLYLASWLNLSSSSFLCLSLGSAAALALRSISIGLTAA